jgi:hypothetical protein
VPAQLLVQSGGNDSLWIYVGVLVVFLGPIIAVVASYEKRRKQA